MNYCLLEEADNENLNFTLLQDYGETAWPMALEVSLKINLKEGMLESISIGSQFQLLAPTFVDREYIGFIYSPFVNYSFSQNMGAGLSMRFPFGGELSYFDFSNRKQVEVMLELVFQY